MTSDARTRFLHVANGTCTTRLIEAAGIPGTLSIWADPLHEGPVPGGLTDAELVDVRTRYLAGSDGPLRTWSGSDPSADPINDLRRWRAVLEDHTAYDELILWFEHDLFDQLNLIHVLTWIGDRLPTTKAVSLVCIGVFPGRPDFKGLGELTPDDIASLFVTRQRVTPPQHALARRAWQALREPTPEALDALRRENTSALPFLSAAITRFLQEYPWTTDGLSLTERRLLTVAREGEIRLATAFGLMNEGERAYYVTDTSLAIMAADLSGTSPPLLVVTLDANEEPYGLRGSVTLSDAGRAALAARLDRVAACGIDRWLGGVHLRSDAPMWRWDDARGGIVADAGRPADRATTEE